MILRDPSSFQLHHGVELYTQDLFEILQRILFQYIFRRRDWHRSPLTVHFFCETERVLILFIHSDRVELFYCFQAFETLGSMETSAFLRWLLILLMCVFCLFVCFAALVSWGKIAKIFLKMDTEIWKRLL